MPKYRLITEEAFNHLAVQFNDKPLYITSFLKTCYEELQSDKTHTILENRVGSRYTVYDCEGLRVMVTIDNHNGGIPTDLNYPIILFTDNKMRRT